jgi:hypothetical protein
MATDIQFGSGFHKRNPDVLTCIANLSNDEVFTPPALTKQMLDSLTEGWASSNNGENIWSRSDLKFLDPFTKSGVFLREITKRLTEGLQNEIANLEERVDHILTKQVFGIGITELTAQLARRSLYCSKDAQGKHSIASSFRNSSGNIWFESTEHDWVGGREKVLTADQNGNAVEYMVDGICKFCGTRKKALDRDSGLETHAYKLIHSPNVDSMIEEVFGEKMQFDVVIGNPPYQLNVGNTGSTSATAIAIYHDFVKQAMSLNPRVLTMVIPSRWMTRSTKGVPEQWIDEMLNDRRVRVLHDFLDSTHVFPGVEIKGGVCYFLWDRDNEGKCDYVLHKNEGKGKPQNKIDYLNSRNMGVVIRDIEAHSILEKIEAKEGAWYSQMDRNFSSFVSPKDFFTNKEKLTTSWKDFAAKKDKDHPIKYYVNKGMHQTPFGYVSHEDIPKNVKVEEFWKVYIPASGWGAAMDGDDPVLGRPFVGEPHSVCSQTYLVIGYDQDKRKLTQTECQNIVSYVSTKFFRYMVSLKKYTQQASRGVYQFVPLQEFSEEWTDDKLYKKYSLNADEVQLIENKIRAMELNGE